MNVSDYLLENAQDPQIAIVLKDRQHTYGELRTAAARLAADLAGLGLKAGQRVGLLGQNSLFWAAAYLATMKLGLVSVPFSTMLTPEEMGRNAAWVDCKAVFFERRQQRKFGGAFGSEIAILGDELLEQPGPSTWPQTPADFDAGQDAALMATSGTTQRPRMVRITHGNIRANTESIVAYLALDRRERILVILPFYYCFGTSLLHTHLRVGGSLALCNTFTFPETAIDLMESAECTGFAGVPSSFQLLLRNSTFPRRATASLRKIQQAGGKLHKILIEELVAAKPQAKVYVMYGQTEATARLSYLPPEALPARIGSIGRGIPGVTLQVRGEGGGPVRPGEVGEIIARGDNISPGYLDDPEASAEKFVDGALLTGDLATVDEAGYIFVVDRKADFIKSWGYRVSSQEVEAAVLQHPDVVSAAVVGAPDLAAGEAIHAFVTLRGRSDTTPEQLLEHCRARLAKHMIPGYIHVIKSMPLNAHGKVVKSELRKLAVQSNPSGVEES
ncbi:MAG: class I adenylate-forming enzyme family protein [Chloroflexota bacterium]